MFDWIKVENLDPRLITISASGKINSDNFPLALALRGIYTRQDLVVPALGEVTFINNDPHVQVTSTGNHIFFSTNFVPSNLNFIWSDNSYLRDTITLRSTNGFTIASGGGNSIMFSPNAVHSLQSLKGNLTLDTEGDINAFTDTSQRSISFSLAKITESTVDPSSFIDTTKVITEEGLSLAGEVIPSFTSVFQSGNLLQVAGLTGTNIVKPQFTQLTCTSINFIGSSVFENSGQIQVTSDSVSLPADLLQIDFKPAYEYSFGASSYSLISGIYTQTFTHSGAKRPLWITMEVQGSQLGFGRPFSRVLSYIEQQDYLDQIPSTTSGIQNKYLALMANPDNLTGSTLTTYQSLLADIMGDYLTFNHNVAPYVALTGAISQLSPPKSTNYMALVTGTALTSTGSMPLLTGLVAGKSDFQYIVGELEKPQLPAYYYEFTDSQVSIYLKSPTATPPSGSAKILFAHA